MIEMWQHTVKVGQTHGQTISMGGRHTYTRGTCVRGVFALFCTLNDLQQGKCPPPHTQTHVIPGVSLHHPHPWVFWVLLVVVENAPVSYHTQLQHLPVYGNWTAARTGTPHGTFLPPVHHHHYHHQRALSQQQPHGGDSVAAIG